MSEVYQGLWTGVSLAATFALVAAGFSLFYRASGYINMAHGAGVMIVGYLLAALYGNTVSNASLPFLGLAIGGIVGLVSYVLLALPAMRRGGRHVLAVTLGGSFAAAGAVQALWGTSGRGLAPFATSTVTLPGGTLTGQEVVGVGIAVVVGVGLAAMFRLTMVGRALQAVAEDSVGASCVGINPRAMQALAMVVSGALAGLAAAIIVPQQGVDANSGNTFLLVAIVAAVLGGMRSLWGTTIGALVLGLVSGVITGVAPAWIQVVEFGLLIAVLAVRPQGLMARRAA